MATTATKLQSLTVPNRRVSILSKPSKPLKSPVPAQLRRESLITASALAELQQSSESRPGRSRHRPQAWVTACALGSLAAGCLLLYYASGFWPSWRTRQAATKSAPPPATRRNPLNCDSGTITIIAHADDDLLFQSPYIIDAIQDGCFTTVVTSAGDAGQGLEYARLRERGNEAAHARMLDVEDKWSMS